MPSEVAFLLGFATVWYLEPKVMREWAVFKYRVRLRNINYIDDITWSLA